MPNNGRLALLLNGGGAKGICQAGAIKALVDRGLCYESLYGASVGALNGALLHQGDLDLMEELWMTIKSSDVYKWWPWDVLRLRDKRASLYDSSPLRKLIEKKIRPNALRDNPHKFYINATSQTTWEPLTGEVHNLSDAELITLLYASASPPIFFPSVELYGHRLVDAGVVNNYSITQAIKDGHDTLIVIGFAVPDPQPVKGVRRALEETIAMMMFGYYDREKSAVEKINQVIDEGLGVPGARDIRLIEIIPPKPLGIDLLDFNYKGSRRELFNYGYRLASEVLGKELLC